MFFFLLVFYLIALYHKWYTRWRTWVMVFLIHLIYDWHWSLSFSLWWELKIQHRNLFCLLLCFELLQSVLISVFNLLPYRMKTEHITLCSILLKIPACTSVYAYTSRISEFLWWSNWSDIFINFGVLKGCFSKFWSSKSFRRVFSLESYFLLFELS